MPPEPCVASVLQSATRARRPYGTSDVMPHTTTKPGRELLRYSPRTGIHGDRS